MRNWLVECYRKYISMCTKKMSFYNTTLTSKLIMAPISATSFIAAGLAGLLLLDLEVVVTQLQDKL